MAKITITIEDQPNGTVSCKAEPNFAFMAKIDASGNILTAAHGYALLALNAVREASKQNRLVVGVPRARKLK